MNQKLCVPFCYAKMPLEGAFKEIKSETGNFLYKEEGEEPWAKSANQKIGIRIWGP